ncbi:MAG TPA: MMPL family transporter, partial [Propionibacteriaceae bacterium]|nr:MMPL family transporter [Propionibacteriaceae bacterium]
VVVVIAALGALSYPAKDLWLSLPNAGQLPAAEPARQTYDAISREFGPGFNGPLVVTMQLVESTDPLGDIAGMRADIEKIPGVKLVAIATPNQNADTGMIHVIPTTGPDDPRTELVVDAIRDKVPDWQARYKTTAYVTGMTAVGLDITERLSGALLPFGIFVVGLSLVLLTMVFRSIWVPVKAAFGYLLSIGSAFGATTLVFNKGWFMNVVNLHETTAVISFFPIITMGILFGLAMDYEVFLVSRMREEHVHGGDARQAVHDGFVHSAKVVAAAAVIMFAVFAFFVPNGEGAIKPIAFGLAVGVAIDAFVVRMVLVPAVMHLLGERAWWLPGWLGRLLPSLDVEGESLAHQLSLANWPTPDDKHVVYGEDVAIGDDPARGLRSGVELLTGLDLAVSPGQVLVVAGPADRRAGVLLTISGRMAPSAGRLKVLGHVLPDSASKVRAKSLLVDPHTRGVAHRLETTSAPLVLVDDADHLHGSERAALAELLTHREGRAIVLSCARADSVRELITPDDLVLDVTPLASGTAVREPAWAATGGN